MLQFNETNSTTETNKYVELRVADALWRYLSPVIIVVGITGNILSFLVMSRPQLRDSITSLLLRVLALVDIAALLVGLLRHWITIVFDIDVSNVGIVAYLKMSQRKRQNSSQIKLATMTVMLLLVAVVFIMTVTPICVYLAIDHMWENTKDSNFIAQTRLFWAASNMLMYTNNAVNFFLYCLSGPKFRRELFRMLSGNKIAPETQLTLTNMVAATNG